MTKILAIDAGVTTGYILFDSEKNTVLQYGELKVTELSRLAEAGNSVEVIIEDTLRFQRGELAKKLEAVMDNLSEMFPKAKHILASVWKGTRWAYVSVPPYLNSDHMRDAYCIAIWYAEQFLRKEKR